VKAFATGRFAEGNQAQQVKDIPHAMN
jgi:hypothetical protein